MKPNDICFPKESVLVQICHVCYSSEEELMNEDSWVRIHNRTMRYEEEEQVKKIVSVLKKIAKLV